MGRLEQAFLYLGLGFVAPIVLLLAGWWGSLAFVTEEHVKWFLLGGFIVGLAIDALYLRKWVTDAYNIERWKLLLIMLFYQIGMFGFFMGVPLFNLIIPFAAGYYLGKRLLTSRSSGQARRRAIRNTAAISACLMVLVCAASAWFALNDAYTASSLQGMLGLSFLPTTSQLWMLVLVGGTLLVAIAYFLTYLGNWAAGNRFTDAKQV